MNNMTKVLQLGHGFDNPTDIGETYNLFNDINQGNLADVWSNLYEGNQDIEKQDKNSSLQLVKWLRENNFSKSAKHIERIMKVCK